MLQMERRRDIALSQILCDIAMVETLGDYDRRNKLVIEALWCAMRQGLEAGIRIDPEEPEWPVIFIELEQGQVSWHIEQHKKEWDGHDTKEKYRRVREYLEPWLDP